MVKIIQDVDKCIGCGACVSVCGDNWEMGDDGKAHPKDANPKEIGCNQTAADTCPVQCIKVE